jgi:tetratricopeptide (TPR) repeat protein
MFEAEQARFYARQAEIRDEPVTEYGFVGRDLDIQAIERQLLAWQDSNELLVQGMAGAGKSTLLAHLAWWWQRTSMVQEVFRFSWEDRAWTAAQIIREIRSRLLSPIEQAKADLMSLGAQLEQAASLLRSARHLLILDNAESITATPAAIPHAIDPGEQALIRTLLARLRGGKTLVLVGSREAEAWLAPGTFAGSVYPLPGLDTQASSTLTDRILRRYHAAGWLEDDVERQALQDVTGLLGGYPLAMTVVLPALAATPPSRVLADLRAGDPGPDPAQRIIVAIEYSHGRLDPALQGSLLLLAPFTAVIPPAEALADYRGILLDDGAAEITGEPDLVQAVAEAVRVGLAVPHPQVDGWVQVQPVFPYFLRTRLRGRPALRDATARAHYQLYTRLGAQLHQLLTTQADPQARTTGKAATRAEYANLTTALAWGLQASQPIRELILPLEEYLDQAGQQIARRKLLDDAIAGYPEPVREAQQLELALLHNLAGVAAASQHRLEDARRHQEIVLQLEKATDNRRGQARTYHQLGIIAQEQRRFADAEANFRKALDIKLELGDRHSAADTYHELGYLAQEQQRFTEAEANYRKALDTFLEFEDLYETAGTYHQLGYLAQEQQRFTEAEANFRKALDIKLEFGDRNSAGSTYHHLGMVAQEQQRFEEAEANYRQALEIFLEFGHRHETADVYHQIGTVAQEEQRFTEAEANYRQALEIFLEFGDRHSAADTYYQLGMVAQKQQRLEDAEASYRQALDTYLESDPQRAYTTAKALGRMLAEVGRHAEAAAVLLDAVLLWYQVTGNWDPGRLRDLSRERAVIGQDAFSQLLTAKIPQDLRPSLVSALHSAEDA